MLTVIFFIGFIWFVFKVIGLAFKATWSITKILFRLILFPAVLLYMAFSGMLMVAMILLIVGLVFSKE